MSSSPSMVGVAKLQKHYSDLAAKLFIDYHLNDQFCQLHLLQDENNPDFVVNFMSGYFKESERMLHEMNVVLQHPVVDYKKVRELAHKLRGSSASVGANRVTEICKSFRGLVELQNVQRLKQCMYQAYYENRSLKENLQVLFEIEKKIKEAGTKLPDLNPNPQRPDPTAGQAQPDTGSGAFESGTRAPTLGINAPRS